MVLEEPEVVVVGAFKVAQEAEIAHEVKPGIVVKAWQDDQWTD